MKDEFALIDAHFRPLTDGFPGSFSLSDDAALLTPPVGKSLIITKDVMVADIHYTQQEDAALIARKLLRVNLSDLSAKGAVPYCYFLGLALPTTTDENWIARFSAGLAQDQKEYGISLAGGDTTSTHGPAVLSLTAIGTTDEGKMLRRDGAKAGEDIYLSGTVGDTALGLKALRHEIKVSDKEREFLVHRYHLPQPHAQVGAELLSLASAAMDVSDGLMQDLSHLCKASGVGAELFCQDLPLSAAASEAIAHDSALWETIATGGDDYEILFTATVEKREAIQQLAKRSDVPLTRIGTLLTQQEVILLDPHEEPFCFRNNGWKHF